MTDTNKICIWNYSQFYLKLETWSKLETKFKLEIGYGIYRALKRHFWIKKKYILKIGMRGIWKRENI